MSFGDSFAGFDEPELLARDPALTHGQKLTALRNWRRKLEQIPQDGKASLWTLRRKALLQKIDQTLQSMSGKSAEKNPAQYVPAEQRRRVAGE